MCHADQSVVALALAAASLAQGLVADLAVRHVVAHVATVAKAVHSEQKAIVAKARLTEVRLKEKAITEQEVTVMFAKIQKTTNYLA